MFGYKSLLKELEEKIENYPVLLEMLEEISKTQVVIPAGGYGKRMGMPNIPKPMIKLANGETLIEHCIKFYRNCGYRDFKILTGYKADVIENYLGDGRKLGVKITYCRDPEIEFVGRGKAFKNAIEKGVIDSRRKSMLTFSDDLFWDPLVPINHENHHSFYRKFEGKLATLLTVKGVKLPYGVIKEDEHGTVKEFVEKPTKDEIISTGSCIMEPEVYDIILERVDMDAQHPVELERVVYPYLAKKGKLAHYMHPDPKVWTPVNTIKELEIVNKRLKAGVA